MLTQAQSVKKSRLGNILLSGQYITTAQLTQALEYQLKRQIKLGTALIELKYLSRRQLNFALRRQSWSRAIATSLALAIAPFTSAVASEKVKSSFNQTVENNPSLAKSIKDSFVNNIYFTTPHLDQQSKDYYYSGKALFSKTNQYAIKNSFSTTNQPVFSINKDFSSQSGIRLGIYRSNTNISDINFSAHFEPQISLFKSNQKAKAVPYSSRGIAKGLSRSSNTQPIVYMLTIKGRSIFENSDTVTKFWSLNRIKRGAQRKAQLMFSVTKQF